MVYKSLAELVGNKAISYSQNFEDIVLSRALGNVKEGFYIDIGAAWPDQHSVTKLFYDAGWRGVNVEPNVKMHQSLESNRPRDTNLNVGVSDESGELEFYCFDDLGLSTFSHEIVLEHSRCGRIEDGSYKNVTVNVVTLESIFDKHVKSNQDVHFLKIDAEGYESKIVLSNDWSKNRPWIVVCEATSPGTMDDSFLEFDRLLIDNGYVFAYFDQLNRFYVAKEKESLIPKLSLPPSSFDEFVRYEDINDFWQREIALYGDLSIALTEKESAIAEKESAIAERESACAELLNVRNSLSQTLGSKSWFITKPFRAFLRLLMRLKSPYAMRGALIIFLVKSSRLSPLRRLVSKNPKLSRYLKRKLIYGVGSDTKQYESIVIDGLQVNVYAPALLDSRGIGRVANGIVSELRKRAETSSNKFVDSVYFYPALNISPEVLDQPSLLMVHDTIPLDFNTIFPSSVVREWEGYGKLITQASKIVTISKSTSEDLMKHYDVSKSKVTVVYNGVVKLSPVDGDVFIKPGDKEKPYFIMLGSADVHKNTETMLQVWSDDKVSNQFDLLIVGDSNRIPEIWDGDLPSGVHVLGYVSDDNLAGLLSNAEALLFPSLKEGFGLPPFEAALLGVPSICSNRPAMNELLKGAALFVDPMNKDEWSEAIFKLSTNVELRKRIVVKAKANAEKYSVERNADALLKALDLAAQADDGIDMFMRSALGILMNIESTEKKIVPLPSLKLVQNSVPYVSSYYSDLAGVGVVLFHKGEIDFLPTRLIEHLLNEMTFVYGNPVYNIYSKKDIAFEPQNIEHKFELEDVLKSRIAAVKGPVLDDEREQSINIGVVTANNMGNIGDDAITLAALDMLAKAYPDAKITLTPMPFNRHDYDQYDILVIGGGGLFYDADINNAANYCNVILYANETNKLCFCIGVGVQGIRTELGSELFRSALNTVEFVVVRDKRDKEILTSIGVESKMVVTQDVVFSLPYTVDAGQPVGKKLSDKPTAIIALLDSRNLLAAKHMVSYQKALEQSVQLLSERFEIVFLCQSLDDLDLYRELKKNVGGEIVTCGYDELESIGEIYKAADLVVTSRFHGLIFSILFRKPVLAIGTNGSKIERLISHSFPSLEKSLIPIKTFTLSVFKEKIDSHAENADDFLADEGERRAAIEKANETIDVIKSFRKPLDVALR